MPARLWALHNLLTCVGAGGGFGCRDLKGSAKEKRKKKKDLFQKCLEDRDEPSKASSSAVVTSKAQLLVG